MIDRTLRRRARWWSLAAAAALLVTSCSTGSDGASSGGTTAGSSSLPSSAASGTVAPAASASPTGAGSTTPGPDPSAPATPGQALASREFTVPGTYVSGRLRMRFDLVELKRRGDLLDLTATVTNLEKEGSRNLKWQVGNEFGGPVRKDITGGDNFSGAVLTDVAGKKRYLVASDTGDACVCTSQLNQIFIDAGQSIELSATYAAPPASTTTLDVAVPTLRTFRDLAIS